MLVRQHAFAACCATRKPPKALTAIELRDLGRHQIDEGAARPRAGVVDDKIGRGDLALDQAKQALDLLGVGGVARKRACPGFGA